jgi:phenylacetate-CoA ligase
MVIFRGVNFYPREVESIVLGQPGVGHEYQIVLERTPAGTDRLTLLIEAGAAFGPPGLQAIRHRLKQELNLSPDVVVMNEGEIPRAQGKSARVVDRRPAVGPRA